MSLQPRPESGWPFWWRWVVATNLGWFPGIFLGLKVAELVPESALVRACVAAVIAGSLFGATQAFVLRGFISGPSAWWWSTVSGWSAGVILARMILDSVPLPLAPLLDTVGVACIAGGVVGVPQAWVLSGHTRRWAWWPAISAVGWGVLFPGAVPGLGLIWLGRSSRGSLAAEQPDEPDTNT